MFYDCVISHTLLLTHALACFDPDIQHSFTRWKIEPENSVSSGERVKKNSLFYFIIKIIFHTHLFWGGQIIQLSGSQQVWQQLWQRKWLFKTPACINRAFYFLWEIYIYAISGIPVWHDTYWHWQFIFWKTLLMFMLILFGSYLIDGLFTVLVLLSFFLGLLPLFDVVDEGEKVTQVQYNWLCLWEDNWG